MFDIFALTRRLWQNFLFPLFQRLSFRVTPLGLRVIGGWLLVVIVINLLAILPRAGVLDSSLTGIFNTLNWLIAGLSLLLALAVLADYLWLLQATRTQSQALLGGLKIHRQVNNNLSVQAWSKVTLTLSHLAPPTNISLTLVDNYPLLAKAKNLPLTLNSSQLKRQSNQEVFAKNAGNSYNTSKSEILLEGCDVTYELYPTERGFGDFAGVDMLLNTRIGLLAKYCPIAESHIHGVHDVRVLANFSEIIQGHLLGVTQKTALTGILKQQRQGQGQDFRQIRNYSEGDSIRHIDWKATARQHKLMTREFQDERDQNILFLLDCGQHMRHIQFFDDAQNLTNANSNLHHDVAKKAQGSHLDQALNAMLLLAEVANQQGDATGFVSFAGQNDKIIPPKKGQQVISYLLNQSFDLQPSMLLPDYIAVARTVRSVQKKRSLVILITNTRQEEQNELSQALKLLSAKHVVIMANLIETDVKNYITQSPITADEALTYHSVQEYLTMRERLHSELSEETNIHPLSCTPEQLPTMLIQQYLKVKHRHRL